MDASGSHSSTLQESFGSEGERRVSKPQWTYLVLTHLPCRNPSEAEESDAPPSLNGRIWYSLIYLAGVLRKRRRATCLQASMEVSATHSSTLQESFGSGGERRASKPQWTHLVLTHLRCGRRTTDSAPQQSEIPQRWTNTGGHPSRSENNVTVLNNMIDPLSSPSRSLA